MLCPMNRGRLGARALNVDLQAALNGDQSTPSVVRFGCSFRSGDKVMQTINDYDKMSSMATSGSFRRLTWKVRNWCLTSMAGR